MRDYTTNPSITACVTALQAAVAKLAESKCLDADVAAHDEEVVRRIADINDRMPEQLAGVELMLMLHPDVKLMEFALRIPTELVRFFSGHPIMWYPSVIVEVSSTGLTFLKNRYGSSSKQLSSLEGTVVLCQDPHVAVTFTTPRTVSA